MEGTLPLMFSVLIFIALALLRGRGRKSSPKVKSGQGKVHPGYTSGLCPQHGHVCALLFKISILTNCMHACSFALVVSDSLLTLWTIAHRALLSVGFSRQDYWSGLPCPLPGDLPEWGIEARSLMPPAWAGRFFTTSATLMN